MPKTILTCPNHRTDEVSMKRIKKKLAISLSALCSVAVISVPSFHAFAESNTQDGIEASITLTQSQDSSDLDANFEILNTNNFDLNDISLDFTVPSGYELSTDSLIPTSIDVLKSGESQNFALDFVKVASTEIATESNSVSTKASTSVTTKVSTSVTTGSSGGSAPKTGDDFPLSALLSISMLAGAGAVICVKKKQGKRLLSLLLCVSMGGTMMTQFGSIKSSAAEELRTFTLSDNIEVDSETVNISVTLTYNYPTGEQESKNINFNMNDALYDADSDMYYVIQEKPVLDGTIKDVDNLTDVSYTITDCNNAELMSGTLEPSATWSINDLGLVVGENNITVSLKYSDGTTDSSTIKANNLCESNMNTLDVDKGDDDNDGVLNFIEVMYHTNPKLSDSDNDGLTDYDEMAILGTDPMSPDTGGVGIDDSKKDSDGDGISNYDEIYVHKTNPVSVDSDGDGLSDYDEIFTYHTDPNKSDTDDDIATDYWEIIYGFDPLTFNSDFGELDPTGSNSIKTDDGAEITIILDDAFLNESTPGYMGVDPYLVEVGDTGSATLTVPFNSDSMSAEDDPTLYYFNEETQRLEEVPTTITEDGKAVSTVDKSGTYILLNRRYVSDVWENDIIPPSSTNIEAGSMDIVFVIDRSASMDSNDPDGIRKQVVNEFIDKLRPEDRVAIIQYTAIAETVMPITTDKVAAKKAVDSIENSDGGGCAGTDENAGTNGAAGLRNALNELDDSTAAYKYVIFLTDGYDDKDYTESNGYTYDDMINEANIKNEFDKHTIIHTIGLVGNGDVDVELLQKIATQTEGNYYLATTGSEAENVPEGVLGLEDVYKDIENKTVDRVKDSNGDGISDYYTKLICEGKLLTSKNTYIFGSDATYEKVQASADYDGDGLLNGEEVKIMETGSAVYGKIISYPNLKNSDNDDLDDYLEVKKSNTSPLKFNSSIDIEDCNWITDNNNFYSNLYLNLYNSSKFEQGSVCIGNSFFGTTADQTILYQKVLTDYFQMIDTELLSKRAFEKYRQFAVGCTDSVFEQFKNEMKNALNSDDEKNAYEEVKEKYYEPLNEIMSKYGAIDNYAEFQKLFESLPTVIHTLNGDIPKINATLERIDEINECVSKIPSTISDSESINKYLNDFAKESLNLDIEHLNIKINTSIGTKASKVIVKGTEVLDKAGKTMSVINLAMNTYEISCNTIKDYCWIVANMELLEDNIYILDCIIASSDNIYLVSAAKNIHHYALNVRNDKLSALDMKLDYVNGVLSSVALDTIHTFFTLFPELTLAIPYVGEVILAMEYIRDFGNTFFDMDKISQAASLTVAASQTADILSKNYSGQLKGGNAVQNNDLWIAYSDYSEQIYSYLLNLTAIRRISENYMKSNKDEKDESGNKIYKDFYFNQPEEIRKGCEKNVDECNAMLDKYNKKLFDYFERISS